MANITYHYEKPIKTQKVKQDELVKIRKLQAKWLKKNKPTKCPDAYMDNPYTQSIYGSGSSLDSTRGGNS